MGAARGGDVAVAREAVDKLAAIQKGLAEAKSAYWAAQVEIQRLAAAGWLARAEKKDDEAVGLLRAAADLEDSTEKHPVTPGSVVPAREMLADLLLELNRPADALARVRGVAEGGAGPLQRRLRRGASGRDGRATAARRARCTPSWWSWGRPRTRRARS